MNIKKNIKNILILTLWIVLGSGVLVLLVAAINVKNHKLCRGIDIEISGAKEYFFLTKEDIIKIVSMGGEDKPAGKIIATFNLQGMETLLEKNVWVKDAELFFDNNQLLHIIILEKEPVARIFTAAGNSFYVDSSGSKLPLSVKITVRLPVFTGFPANKNHPGNVDSVLMRDIKTISIQILNDPFWMAQIAQVSITPDRTFEMIPTVGSHIIQFGSGENSADKFKRLFIFYSQVLSKAGFDKYSRISVQYNKQVIGTKKGTIAKIDSVQALKNIQEMIEESRKVYEDSIYIPAETAAIPKPDSLVTGMDLEPPDSAEIKSGESKTDIKKSSVTPKKTKTIVVPKKKPAEKHVEQRVPKAVMNKE